MQVKSYLDTSLPRAILRAKKELGGDIVIIESREVVNHPDYPGQKMVKVTVGLPEQEEQVSIKKWNPPKVTGQKEQPQKGKPLATPAAKTAGRKKDIRANTYQKVRAEIEGMQPTPKEKPKTAKKDNSFNDMITDILNRKPKELDREKSILDELAKMREEITQLSLKSEQAAIKEKVDGGAKPAATQLESGQFPEPYQSLKEYLQEKGVQDDMAFDLINRAFLLKEGKRNIQRSEVLNQLKSEMSEMLQPYNFDKIKRSKKRRVVLLLGPTGAGKSTVAMKLAANPDIYGKKQTAIISTDPYGPSEALKAFSRMSETVVHEEKDIERTEELLEKYKNKDVLIVDTPGKSPFDPNQLSKMEEFVKKLKPTDIFLVLSVGSDLKDLVLLCANYLLLKPNGIVFTKFDESTQPGKVFSILDVINLPVVSFCDGKKVFIDIHKGEPGYMYKKVLPQETEN